MDLSELQGEIERLMSEHSVPGVAIGILDDGRRDIRGYGVANIASGLAVTGDTLFQLGSISKIFTATLALTLVDDGQLDLDAPVAMYLPELRLGDSQALDDLRVHHLLTHMSGIDGDRFDDHGDGDDALARAVAEVSNLDQQTAPGELFAYCNAGWDILGRVIETMVDMPFEQAMRERVLDPMGLTTTTYFAREAIRHPVAVGHTGREGQYQVADPWPIPRRSNPAGGVNASIPELLTFAECHLNEGLAAGGRIITTQSARSMREPRVEADPGRRWGLGWSLRDIQGLRVVEHAGATNGFMAQLTLVPEARTAIAILTNSEHGSQAHSAILAAWLERQFGVAEPDNKRVTLDREAMLRFTGRFERRLMDVEITLEGEQLMLSRFEHEPFSGDDVRYPAVAVSPISDDAFIVEEGDFAGAVGEFFFAENGAVRFLRMGRRLAMPT